MAAVQETGVWRVGVGTCDGRGALGRTRRRWKENIETDSESRIGELGL